MKFLKIVQNTLSKISMDRRYQYVLDLFQANSNKFHPREYSSCVKLSNRFSFYRDRNIDKALEKLELLETCVMNRLSQKGK